MELFRYLASLLRKALLPALTPAQTIVFIVVVAAYLLSLIPGMPVPAEIADGKLGAIVLVAVVIIRILLAPYWLHVEAQRTIDVLKSQLMIEVAEVSKLTLVELFREAEKLGVDFKERSNAIIKICRSLRQAASEGALEFWGRDQHPWDPLLLIPKTHWNNYEIDWMGAFELSGTGEIQNFAKDNFFVVSREGKNSSRKAYFDIHVNKIQGSQWIQENAQKFTNT